MRPTRARLPRDITEIATSAWVILSGIRGGATAQRVFRIIGESISIIIDIIRALRRVTRRTLTCVILRDTSRIERKVNASIAVIIESIITRRWIIFVRVISVCTAWVKVCINQAITIVIYAVITFRRTALTGV